MSNRMKNKYERGFTSMSGDHRKRTEFTPPKDKVGKNPIRKLKTSIFQNVIPLVKNHSDIKPNLGPPKPRPNSPLKNYLTNRSRIYS